MGNRRTREKAQGVGARTVRRRRGKAGGKGLQGRGCRPGTPDSQARDPTGATGGRAAPKHSAGWRVGPAGVHLQRVQPLGSDLLVLQGTNGNCH